MKKSENKSGFNKNKYDSEYQKTHYKRSTILFKINDYENINSYCKDFNLPFGEYVKMCVNYCVENVHIDELKQYKK